MYFYKKAAEQGDSEAMFNLCVNYEEGYGVTANMTTALAYCEKAAQLGNARAHMWLGRVYQLGSDNITIDMDKAICHFQSAAKACLGADDSVHEEILQVGMERAIKWFEVALENGHSRANIFLGKIYAGRTRRNSNGQTTCCEVPKQLHRNRRRDFIRMVPFGCLSS
jgi:hypothetical protein